MKTKLINFGCLVLVLVNTIMFYPVVTEVIKRDTSPPSPMTSTISDEISQIINGNLKRLNIVEVKTPKLEKENVKSKIEGQIVTYLEQKVVWKNGKQHKLTKPYCEKIAKNVVAYADYPSIVIGIIGVESNFNRKAVNATSKATGLGQIHPIHEKELKQAGIIDTFDDLQKVKNNIEAINFVLNMKLNITNGNMKRALALYSGNANDYNKKVWKNIKDLWGA